MKTLNMLYVSNNIKIATYILRYVEVTQDFSVLHLQRITSFSF